MFGHQGLQPALISTLIVVCLLFAIAVICIVVGLQEERHLGRAITVVVKALSKNPLVIALTASAAWAVLGVPLTDPVLHFLDMLAAATTPCALVSLGLFLGQKTVVAGSKVNPWPLVTIKLIGQPLLLYRLPELYRA